MGKLEIKKMFRARCITEPQWSGANINDSSFKNLAQSSVIMNRVHVPFSFFYSPFLISSIL